MMTLSMRHNFVLPTCKNFIAKEKLGLVLLIKFFNLLNSKIKWSRNCISIVSKKYTKMAQKYTNFPIFSFVFLGMVFYKGVNWPVNVTKNQLTVNFTTLSLANDESCSPTQKRRQCGSVATRSPTRTPARTPTAHPIADIDRQRPIL